MITVLHIFYNDVTQDSFVDKYDNEGTAIRMLGELFYRDEKASQDYWKTMIKDKTTGKISDFDFRKPAERRALDLKQREKGEKVAHDLKMSAWREEQQHEEVYG